MSNNLGIILASSQKSSTENVLKNWNDIDTWWFSDKVQSARNEFCDEFSIILSLAPLKNFSEKLKAFYKYD